ncbi:hypothetical protein MVEN_01103500 [Mycena venus]|uniref:Maestro/Maestro-like HEAT-repeats domain-containing protein n=1 Tax=Mycena venus TaxID=2733690 RepID=A0A8H7CXG9_9AGAR|nr:hypothetical protein MVEN_01103500 [Mycena venus]
MQPLARQQSLPSLLSWWSDSNPPGPTINLHAAAKPFARFLYHRQALEIIRKNHGSPLSSRTLEIYSGYFPWNFVSWSTKAAILREVADRVRSSEGDACAVVESPIFPEVAQMLLSPDARVRSSSCQLLAELAWWDSTALAIVELKPCERLVSLLQQRPKPGSYMEGNVGISKYCQMVRRRRRCYRVGNLAIHDTTAFAILELKLWAPLVSLLHDQDSDVVWRAAYALAQTAKWPDCALAVIEANTFDHILELLASPSAIMMYPPPPPPSPKVREWTCQLVGNLASHELTALSVMEVKPYEQLVSLLHDQDYGVIWRATHALAQIARWLDGAHAVIEADIIGYIFELLGSPSPNVQGSVCELIGHLAMHESTGPTILELNPCELLVSLLHDQDSGIVWKAIYALAQIARWEDGAHAIIKTNSLNRIFELLGSQTPMIRERTCELVGSLACHESIAPVILEIKPCELLVSLLCDRNSEIIWSATYALARIAGWLDGAHAVIAAQVIDYILELLRSPNSDVQGWTCELVGNLALHESTGPTILKLNPCELLVSLLHDQDSGIVWKAIYALAQIARWEDGAHAIIKANSLNRIFELLGSQTPMIRERTCELVGSLACHESTTPAVVEIKSCERLVSLLCDQNSEIIWSATYALARIAGWLDGAHAIIAAQVIDYILELLRSPNSDVRKWTCELVGNLATYESTAPALFELKVCAPLVFLLQDQDSDIIWRAAYALAQISRPLNSVQAVIEADVIDHILELLKSPSSDVRKWTCELVGNLAAYESTAPALFELKVCAPLVSLLHDQDSDVIWRATYALARIAGWLDGAHAVIEADTIDHILVLLGLLSPNIQGWTCELVGNLALHESTGPTILKLNPCELLMSLLRDQDSGIVWKAIYALAQIARWEDGAHAIIKTNSLNCIFELLGSPTPMIRERTCELVGSLACHESIASFILAIKPCELLVSLLCDRNSEIIWSATYALARIAGWLDGAHAVIAAQVIDYILELLRSPNSDVRKWTCELVGNLATHESTTPALFELKICAPLVSLFHDPDSDIIWRATYALALIAGSSDGAAIIDANAMAFIPQLIESPNIDVQKWTCILVAHLAIYGTIAPPVLEPRLCTLLLSLSRNQDSGVIFGSMYALAHVVQKLGAAAIDADAMAHIPQLMESSNVWVQGFTCVLVAALAGDESTAPAILELKLLCPAGVLLAVSLHPLVVMWFSSSNSDHDSLAVWSATYALARIAEWPDGAHAVIEAQVIAHILELLGSPSSDARKWTCKLVGNLATYESTAQALFELRICAPLVFLLHDQDEIIWRATYALAQISQWIDGAQAVIEADVIDHVLELLGSPNSDVRKWTCRLVGNLAEHKSTAPSILELKPSAPLVSLLRDPDSDVISSATYTLAQISRWLDGPHAVIEANALEHIIDLLESPNPQVRELACQLVGSLACHESTAPVILEIKPCEPLLSLLCDEDSAVTCSAMYALARIARWLDGAHAVIDVQSIDHILELPGSQSPDVQKWTRLLVGNLAGHAFTAPAIWGLNPSLQLMCLLKDTDVEAREAALLALDALSEWPDGVANLTDADVDVLKRLEEPIPDQSLNLKTQGRVRKILDNLAQYKTEKVDSTRNNVTTIVHSA